MTIPLRTDSMFAQHVDKTTQWLQRIQRQSSGTDAPAQDANPFANLMLGGVMRVNEMQNSASSQMEQLLTGGDVNQAEVFTSVQKADMSFRLLVQIRNKLMEAYEELNAIRV